MHNGIIENYLEIKRELVAKGHKFQSETDTEVVAHLVQKEWKDDGLENAVLRAMKRVRGLFALVLLSADDPEKLVAVRNGPPIVVGIGEGEYFVASRRSRASSATRATSCSWTIARWRSSPRAGVEVQDARRQAVERTADSA